MKIKSKGGEESSKKKKKAKVSEEGEAPAKSKKAPKEKKPRAETRKTFILAQVESAGAKGITIADLVKATDKKFDYASKGEGKTSNLRVNNTVREAKEAGLVKANDDGLVTWAKK